MLSPIIVRPRRAAGGRAGGQGSVESLARRHASTHEVAASANSSCFLLILRHDAANVHSRLWLHAADRNEVQKQCTAPK